MPSTDWLVQSSHTTTYLMLIRYWARATDSAFPVMVMVRSRLAGASRSSQLEIRIMAPESCLQRSHWNTTLWGGGGGGRWSSPDLRYFRSSLPDDAADELVGDGHLVGLLLGSLVPSLTCQKGESWNRNCEIQKLFTFPPPPSLPTETSTIWKIPYFPPCILLSYWVSTGYWVLGTTYSVTRERERFLQGIR